MSGCEWDPERNDLAFGTDHHHQTSPATMIVGANGQFRLCDSCAALPRFKRFRVRKPVRRQPGKFEVIAGKHGHVGLYLNGTRIAGDKPCGGGQVVYTFFIKSGPLPQPIESPPTTKAEVHLRTRSWIAELERRNKEIDDMLAEWSMDFPRTADWFCTYCTKRGGANPDCDACSGRPNHMRRAKTAGRPPAAAELPDGVVLDD